MRYPSAAARHFPRTLLRIGLAGVLTASAASGFVLVSSTTAHAVSGATIVAVAQAELVNSSRNHETPMQSNCNFYSGYWGSGAACGVAGFTEAQWCADFVRYV